LSSREDVQETSKKADGKGRDGAQPPTRLSLTLASATTLALVLVACHAPQSQGTAGSFPALGYSFKPEAGAASCVERRQAPDALLRGQERPLWRAVSVPPPFDIATIEILKEHRHFVKDDLPRIKYANPNVHIEVNPLSGRPWGSFVPEMVIEHGVSPPACFLSITWSDISYRGWQDPQDQSRDEVVLDYPR
jgi:hypothetical protein